MCCHSAAGILVYIVSTTPILKQLPSNDMPRYAQMKSTCATERCYYTVWKALPASSTLLPHAAIKGFVTKHAYAWFVTG
jgi:hypothetical protein